jgi:hypothetical protein
MIDVKELPIYNPDDMYELGSEEHEAYLKATPHPYREGRNLKNQFLKGFSGNTSGKGKNSKSKLSKQSLVSFFRSNGIEALEMAATVMRDAYKRKDLNTALRAATYIGGEHVKFIYNQEKNELAFKVAKAKDNSESEEIEEEQEDYSGKVVFKSFSKASGDE